MWLRLPPVNYMADVGSAVLGAIAGDEEPVEGLQEPIGDERLLQFAFSDPLLEESALLSKPAASITDIRNQLDDLFVSIDDFWALGQGIELLGHSAIHPEVGPPILQVTFEANGVVRQAYAYGDLISPALAPNGASLIIPGSGQNQASSIATSDPENYHCCMWDRLEGFAKFVLIKPIQDARAIHDGYANLNPSFYVVDFLARGGSYSATYITEAAAMVAFLKSHYGRAALLGLSQGGKAALVTSLLVQPEALVVASGYSSLYNDMIRWANPTTQIIIPDISKRMSFDSLAQKISIPTLFTWGEAEEGTHGIEASDLMTCRQIHRVDNFECLIHSGGHIFPEVEVFRWLEKSQG